MSDVPATSASPARTRWMIAAGLFLGTLLLYVQVGAHPFISFDDNRYLTENPTVQAGITWAGLRWALTTLHVSNWHPLTWLSHMLDVELFGVNPGAHHIVNVVFHAANAVLVFLVFARMTGATWRSAFVAALFAVHPTHVESVAWVAERKDVLSTLFGLLALLAYVGWARRGGTGRYLAVVALFAASLLAKPMWVTLPFLLLLLDVWPLQRWAGSPIPVEPEPPALPRVAPSRLLLEKLPLLALSLGSSVVTIIAQDRGGAITGLELGVWPRVGNAAISYLRYVGKTIWPWPLSVYYPHPASGTPAWLAVGAVSVVLLITAGAIASARSRPWLAVGWLWFLGTMVPVIGLVQVGAQAMADRYTYLPTIGLYVIAAWGLGSLASRWGAQSILRWGAGLAIVVLAAVTWAQTSLWSDHIRLFRHALEVEGGSGVVHGVLSEGYRKAGRLEEALAEAENAVRLAPGTVRHWNNLGISLRDLKRLPEARAALVQATMVDPAYPTSWVNLGLVEMDLGRHAAALEAYERAAALGTTVASAWGNLAVLYASSGRFPEAQAAFQRAVELEPGSAPSWFNLGVFQLRAGRVEDAIRSLETASRIDPTSPEIARRLQDARSRAGGGPPR